MQGRRQGPHFTLTLPFLPKARPYKRGIFSVHPPYSLDDMEETLGSGREGAGGCQALGDKETGSLASYLSDGGGAPPLFPSRQSLGISPVLVPAPVLRGHTILASSHRRCSHLLASLELLTHRDIGGSNGYQHPSPSGKWFWTRGDLSPA